jgi:hypothetical protein
MEQTSLLASNIEFIPEVFHVNTKRKTRSCPECDSENVAGIVYGYPSEEMFDQSERGDIVLGGCCVTEDDPEWRCKDCENEW